MAIIKWKKCYETGIMALDAEHKGLVEQINILVEAILQKNPETVLLPIFDVLVQYTERHFSHEEALLAEYHYPEFSEQEQEHKELKRRVLEYREKLIEGSQVEPKEILNFLRAWLLDHIVDHDLKYGPYLESRGGRFIT